MKIQALFFVGYFEKGGRKCLFGSLTGCDNRFIFEGVIFNC